MSLEQLEAFTEQLGEFGPDPFIEPMEGHPNILEQRREPNEIVSNFGAGWHSDWSFQETLAISNIPPCPATIGAAKPGAT